MNRGIKNRGISSVVTTLLFVLLAIGAVLLVWNLVRGLITNTGDEIDTSLLTTNLEIKSAEVNADAKTVSILVKRNFGEGEIKGLKVILEDSSGNSFSKDVDLDIDELETKRVVVDYSESDLIDVVSVSIAPVLLFSSGKEQVGSTSLKFNLKTGESTGEIDSDGDGLSDDEESDLGTEINNPDSDGDGLSDGEEVNYYLTNPLNPDSDGDGYDDGEEVNAGTDPGNSGSKPPEIPTDGLLLALKFEEATGQQILNSVSGVGPFSVNPESFSPGATAGSGNAIDFDRTALTSGEYIVADGDLLKGKTAVSASLWFNMDGNAGQVSHIIFTDFVNSAQRFRIYLNSNRVIQVGVYDSSFKARSTGQMAFNYGIWYHLVATADTNTDEIKIYLNGVEQSYTGLTPTPLNAFYSPATVGKVYVGAESALGTTVNSPYNGKVDELYVWDRVLTSGEISELYNSGNGKFY